MKSDNSTFGRIKPQIIPTISFSNKCDFQAGVIEPHRFPVFFCRDNALIQTQQLSIYKGQFFWFYSLTRSLQYNTVV